MFKKAIKAVALALCVTMFAGSMDTTAATMIPMPGFQPNS